MLIKRDVYFSAVDENGEEKLFSVNEIIDEKEYLERMYSKKEEETTSEKVDRVSKKVAKIGAGTAAVGLGATALGGGLMGSGLAANSIANANKTTETAVTKGAKRVLGGKILVGAGSKAVKWGGRGALAAGAVWAGNKLINGNKNKKK